MHRTHTSTNVTELKKETDIEKKKNIVLITKNDIRESEENIIMRKIKKKKMEIGTNDTKKVVDSLQKKKKKGKKNNNKKDIAHFVYFLGVMISSLQFFILYSPLTFYSVMRCAYRRCLLPLLRLATF